MVPFELEERVIWRAALALRAKESITILPGQHIKCPVAMESSEIDNVEFGIVTSCGENRRSEIMVAPGPAYQAAWVQIANATKYPVLIDQERFMCCAVPLPRRRIVRYDERGLGFRHIKGNAC